MKRIYICFPEGRYKALTLSYDDGKITDRRLTEIFRAADIRATFHLNSAYLGSSAGHRIPYISEDEVKTLYKGFEVASHTCTHPTMGRTPAALNISEVLKDREALEHLCGYPVQGFSYPNGVYSEELSALLKLCGISYARVTGDTGRFDLPDNYMAWKPTCHHDHGLMELTEKFIQTDYDQRLMLFYVWGHSYEFELNHNWELIEKFADRIGRRNAIWYATNSELQNYMACAQSLIYFADMHGAFNPTATDVWLNVDGQIRIVRAGETSCFSSEPPVGSRSGFSAAPEYQGKFHIINIPSPSGSGKLDAKLKTWRENRPPKTAGNPYHVLGEPIGDMRDNMDQPSVDISSGVSARQGTICNVPVWICEPEGQTEEEKADRPCFLYIHGGSFVGGTAEAFLNVCRYITQKSGAISVSVDYRLAPETAYPNNIEDCMKVLRTLRTDPKYRFHRGRMYLGGDSAGGNLALACAQLDYKEDRKKKLRGMALYYPVTDLTMEEKEWTWDLADYDGADQDPEKHCCQSLRGFEPMILKLYVQNHTVKDDPLVSPIRTPDFSVYPDLLIASAEYDYLRPQVEAFAKKAARAGCSVRALRYNGMNHAFAGLTGIIDQSRMLLDETAEFISQKKISSDAPR